MSRVLDNQNVKFNQVSGETDFHAMVSKNNQDINMQISKENQNLKECLKLLQREIFEIVNIKQDIFTKRFKAEF